MKTIREFESISINHPTDLSSVRLRDFSAQAKVFLEELNGELHCPHADAINFYLYEHLYQEIKSSHHPRETLPENYQELLADYSDAMTEIFYRIFFYMHTILLRESRHIFEESDYDREYSIHDLKNFNFSEFQSKKLLDWTHHVYLTASRTSSPKTFICLSSTPDITMVELMDYYAYVFNDLSWTCEFGGESWYKISLVMREFLEGRLSPKMFIDSVFSLEHNSGSIFNKDVIYLTTDMSDLLDSQADGLIFPYATLHRNDEDISVSYRHLKSNFYHHVGYMDTISLNQGLRVMRSRAR